MNVLRTRDFKVWAYDASKRIWAPVPEAEYSPSDTDAAETAAWYGRGEKPEHEPLDWVRFELAETAKPAKPGLFVVQGEGRYQGLGFNGETFA